MIVLAYAPAGVMAFIVASKQSVVMSLVTLPDAVAKDFAVVASAVAFDVEAPVAHAGDVAARSTPLGSSVDPPNSGVPATIVPPPLSLAMAFDPSICSA